MNIEGFYGIGADLYSLAAKKSHFLKDLYKKISEEISSRLSSGKILDAGTGPGDLLFEIARRARNLEIIGIDISPDMVKIARKHSETMGCSRRVEFQVADISNLPFESGYFDFVVSSLSLHHWANPIESIKEIQRVLKPNGEAWIYDIRRDTSRKTNIQTIKKYGFLVCFILSMAKIENILSLDRAKNLISSPEISFSKKSVEDKGLFFKLQLVK